MKDMHDNIKRDRILGLVVGLIGLVVLFYFDFDNCEFTSWELRTPMGEFLTGIARTMVRSSSTALDIAHNAWAIFQLIYIALVWFYRGRIGHWIIKIVKLVYKKI